MKDCIKNGATEETKPVIQRSRTFRMDYCNRIELIYKRFIKNQKY